MVQWPYDGVRQYTAAAMVSKECQCIALDRLSATRNLCISDSIKTFHCIVKLVYKWSVGFSKWLPRTVASVSARPELYSPWCVVKSKVGL